VMSRSGRASRRSLDEAVKGKSETRHLVPLSAEGVKRMGKGNLNGVRADLEAVP